MLREKKATPEFWIQQSKLHDGQPLLCICDDLNWQDLGPVERTNAYKLVQFVCTHHNVTALMCCHSWVGLTARMRRACDVLCIWPPTLGSEFVPARTIGKELIGNGGEETTVKVCNKDLIRYE